MKPTRKPFPSSRKKPPTPGSAPQGLAPPKNPFTLPEEKKAQPDPSPDSAPPDPSPPPASIAPRSRWPARRRWWRMRKARFFRTTSPLRITGLSLGLLGLVVLAVVLFLPRPSPQAHPSSGKPSTPSKPPAEPTFEALRHQTAMLIREKKLSEAEAQLAIMEKLRPGDPAILSHAGAIAIQRKNYAKARALYRDLQKASPNNYVAAYNLAEIAFVTRDFAEAERRFRSLVRNRAHDDSLLFRVFLCALLQNRPDEAGEIAQQFSRAGPTPVWYYARAVLARRAGQNQEAEALLDQAAILYPDKIGFFDQTLQSLGLL